jgi:hypothetical protein
MQHKCYALGGRNVAVLCVASIAGEWAGAQDDLGRITLASVAAGGGFAGRFGRWR